MVGAYEKSPTVLPLRHCVWTEKRRYAVGGTAPPPHCFSIIGALWAEAAPLSRGRGCPPTALLLTGVFVGDMFLDMSGNFRGEVVGNQ